MLYALESRKFAWDWTILRLHFRKIRRRLIKFLHLSKAYCRNWTIYTFTSKIQWNETSKQHTKYFYQLETSFYGNWNSFQRRNKPCQSVYRSSKQWNRLIRRACDKSREILLDLCVKLRKCTNVGRKPRTFCSWKIIR